MTGGPEGPPVCHTSIADPQIRSPRTVLASTHRALASHHVTSFPSLSVFITRPFLSQYWVFPSAVFTRQVSL